MNIGKDEVEAYKSVEQRIIATAYYTRDTFPELAIDDFYFDNHKKIYKAMLDGVFDLELELNANKYSYDNEWFFLALQNSPSSTPHLVPALIEQSEKRKRRLEIIKELEDLRNPTKEYKTDRNAGCKFLLPEDVITKSEIAWKNKTKIDLGRFDRIGNKLYSIDRSTINVIAARPGIGKTGFSTQLVEEYSHILNEKWLFFSMEMTASQYAERCSKTFFWMKNPDSTEKMSNQWFFHENREDGFARHMVENMVPNMIMVDEKGLSVDDIRRYLKSARKVWGDEIGTVLIDYAQLMRGEGTGEVEKQTRIARDLQVLAGEYPEYRYIVLAQFNRDGGKVMEPTMEDIKGSSAYEDVCDEIMGLWKPKNDNINDLMMISHLKSRQNGASGRTFVKKNGLYFDSPTDDDITYWKECFENGK